MAGSDTPRSVESSLPVVEVPVRHPEHVTVPWYVRDGPRWDVSAAAPESDSTDAVDSVVVDASLLVVRAELAETTPKGGIFTPYTVIGVCA